MIKTHEDIQSRLLFLGCHRAEVLEEVDEGIENFLKNDSDVGDIDLALDTWEEIIEDIEKCNLLTISQKKEEIVKVLEARHKCFVITYTDIK